MGSLTVNKHPGSGRSRLTKVMVTYQQLKVGGGSAWGRAGIVSDLQVRVKNLGGGERGGECGRQRAGWGGRARVEHRAARIKEEVGF